MCGIIGVIGRGEGAVSAVMEGLKRLEYRGYDSAGVAVASGGGLDRRRAAGKLTALADVLAADPLDGRIAIGHTRWATHGAPTTGNAHPHATERVAIVHNGIIENHAELRAELEAAGRVFETETDTESVAQLITHLMDAERLGPREAFLKAVDRLDGAYGIVAVFAGDEETLYAARMGSPLAVGRGEGAAYLGSDAYALAPFTNKVTYLADGDRAVVTREALEVVDASGVRVVREEKTSDASAALVDKGEHRHFMAKEIHEQPEVVGHTLSQYADTASLSAREAKGLDFEKISQLTISACGTAYYAGVVAKYWFERLARLPVEVDVASELRYREPPFHEGAAALFISQSGETADTLAALRHAGAEGLATAAIVNVPESTIAREAGAVFPTHAGPEIGVASTKAFTCQLTALAGLAITAAKARGRIDRAEEERLVRALIETPRHLAEALHASAEIEAIAAEIAKARDVLYIGRGLSFPIALEGALKLKEISYIHAEGYAAGELKHGPIALIDEDAPTVVVAPHDGLFEKTVSNMEEVMARGGRCVLITDPAGAAAAPKTWRTVTIPAVDPMFAPIVAAIPVQLLAYHVAVAKGTDVDQPRNLAKSVTVE